MNYILFHHTGRKEKPFISKKEYFGTGIGLILGVDRILDMCRTTVNVTGDLTATAVMQRRIPEKTAIDAEIREHETARREESENAG